MIKSSHSAGGLDCPATGSVRVPTGVSAPGVGEISGPGTGVLVGGGGVAVGSVAVGVAAVGVAVGGVAVGVVVGEVGVGVSVRMRTGIARLVSPSRPSAPKIKIPTIRQPRTKNRFMLSPLLVCSNVFGSCTLG
jgi:hypothetical protein